MPKTFAQMLSGWYGREWRPHRATRTRPGDGLAVMGCCTRTHENLFAGDIFVVRAKRADRVCLKICQVVGYMRFLST
jgi:hypothetical protein